MVRFMRVFFFDIDGTLIRSGGAGRAAMEAALTSAFEVDAPPEGVLFSGRTDLAIVADLLRASGVEPSEDHIARCLRAYLEHLPRMLAERSGQVLPGIGPLLDHLAGRSQIAVGLLTGNVRRGARIKLKHYGLWHRFPFGGFGDRYTDRADVARAALEEARQQTASDVQPENVWVIGDSPHDVRCARAIGARAIAVATGIHTLDELAAEQPDLLLQDMADTDQLLDTVGV